MRTKRLISALLAIISMAQIYAASDIKFTAQAPKAVVAGDNFRLEYTINVSNAKKMRLPSIEGFQILSGPNVSSRSSTTVVNGKIESSSTITYTYILCGDTEGEYNIPSATVEVSGDTYTSNTLTIKVLPPDKQQQNASGNQQQPNSANIHTSQSSADGTISNSDLFMRAIVSKTRVYEQEALLLTYKVYSLVNLRSLSNKMPDLKNFHVQEVELPQNKEFELENYNGRNYQTLVWSQYVLFPQQSGDLEIPSMSFEGVVAQQMQSTDIFDVFFNGGRYVETKKDLTTNSITIHVDPLPAGKSSAFMGGVGDFSISSEINTLSPNVNDAVTVKVVVSGTGNMKLIKTPEIKYPQDFDVYDPKVENRFVLKTTGQTGNKVFEYLAIPRHSGEYRIPPVDFQFFDVKSGSYKTLSTQEYVLKVDKGDGGEASAFTGYTSVNKEELKYLGEDVRFHNSSYNLIQTDRTFYGSGIFWILILLPGVILLVALYVHGSKNDNGNIVQIKSKKANSTASKRLKKAQKLMKNNQNDLFYDETLRALWGYISDKLNIPVAELSKENIASELSKKNVDDTIIKQFSDLIAECEFTRFAPVENQSRMDVVYDEAVNIIGLMENTIKR